MAGTLGGGGPDGRGLRIAFLIDALHARYQVRLCAGARWAAQTVGADLCCFIGGYFTDGSESAAQ